MSVFGGLVFEVVVGLTMRLLSAEEMDQADSELRGTIKQIWPIQAKKMIDLLVPPKDMLNTGKMTVGKIYAGILLLETWRNNKCVQLECDAPDLQDRKSHEIQEAYIDDGHLHPGHDHRNGHHRSPSIQYDVEAYERYYLNYFPHAAELCRSLAKLIDSSIQFFL